MTPSSKRLPSSRGRRLRPTGSPTSFMVASLLDAEAGASAPRPAPVHVAPRDALPGFTSGTVSETVPVSHGGRTHKVHPGDTLSSIAGRFGVSVPALVELNRLDPTLPLLPGHMLSLPEKNLRGAPAVHRVAPGDTLQSIASKYGVPVAELQSANAMGSSTLIRVGELLNLRGAGPMSARPHVVPAESLPTLPHGHSGESYPEEVVRAARINKSLLLARPAPSVTEAKELVADIARAASVPVPLALAVAQQESGFQHRVVSPVNAVGIMQVTPRSGTWASSLVRAELDLLDAADNVTAGVAILAWLLECTEDEATALAGYYQGLAHVAEHGKYPDTVRFVRSVQVLRSRFRHQE